MTPPDLAAIRAFWEKPITLPKCQRCGHAQAFPPTFPSGYVCGRCGGECWTITTTTEFRDARADILTLLAALSRAEAGEAPSPSYYDLAVRMQCFV